MSDLDGSKQIKFATLPPCSHLLKRKLICFLILDVYKSDSVTSMLINEAEDSLDVA